jgi:signal transduction histidine kinase
MRLQPHRWLIVSVLLLVSLVVCAQRTGLEYVFKPDRIISYLVAVFLIGVFLLLFLNFVYRFREQDAKVSNERQNQRLTHVLRTGNLQLWIYNVRTQHYLLLSETGEYSHDYNPIEFSQLFDRDDFEKLRKAIFEMSEGKKTSDFVELKGIRDSEDKVHYYEMTLSADHGKRHRTIESIICLQHDVTDERIRKEKVSKTLMRFHTVFNSSLVDMIYYDKDGVLRDINDTACQAFNLPNRQFAVDGQFLLKNNPMYAGIDFDKLENTRTTSLVDFGNYTDEVYQTEKLGLRGKMYYESTINPIRNDQGKLEGIYMSGRNVTEMVESFHRQKEGARQLRDATKNIREYIDNINYALRVSDVRLVNYNPSTFTLELSNTIGGSQLHLSQLRCIRLGSPRFRRAISSVLNRMDHRTELPLELSIETEIRDERRHPIWLQFNMVPMKDEEGKIERYFGLCRNMTQMVETEHRLNQEREKAHEAEQLKQSFLTNMSYEIRTPLNTVVGFAELFEADHDEADEALFVDEIKRNSNSLLLLVNDILFLSRLDANMIEYNKVEVDFSLFFDSYCQMGWSSVSPEVKTIIENPYESLMAEIDSEHVGMIIQKVCQRAANSTTRGTIRAKYEYFHGAITIGVEDTGAGISQSQLDNIFERYVKDDGDENGRTGLDLPIVKTLAEQMGGTAEIQSEVGKGTTVWVTIPCEVKNKVKRSDIQSL